MAVRRRIHEEETIYISGAVWRRRRRRRRDIEVDGK
jgi:hypothetical protein